MTMRTITNVTFKGKKMTLPGKKLLSFLMMFALISLINISHAQDPCQDSINVNQPWLEALTDSIESIDCLEGCYSHIAAYCSPTSGSNIGEVIYALEVGGNCADVPTLYFNSEGEQICQVGSIAGSDCADGFIEQLQFIQIIWFCSDVGPPCDNFQGTIEQSDLLVCVGDEVTIAVNVTGGTAPYNYVWDPNIAGSGSSIVVNPTETSVYVVSVTDANGCQIAITAVVQVDQSCGTDTTNCDDNCPTVFDPVCVATASGTILEFDNICLAFCEGFDQSDLIDCSNDTLNTCAGFNVEIFTNTNSSPAICLGETIQLFAEQFGGQGPYAFQWSSGETTMNIEVSPAQTTTYTVVAVDGNGCEAVDVITVFVEDCDTTDCVCPTVDAPVCVVGPNGVLINYLNACFAECDGYSQNDFVDCNNINDCADLSPSGEPIWLGELIDSIETIGCLEGCYSNITAYCTGNTDVPHIIYALETSETCADVPTIYFNEEGDIICQYGAIWGTDCDSAFIPSLTYIDDIWFCPDVSCNNFTGTIEQSDQAVCIGDTVIITTQVVGGTAPYTYSWNHLPNAIGEQTIVVVVEESSVYVVTIVDANGCTIALTAYVEVEPCDTTDCVCPTVDAPVCVLSANGVIITFLNDCFAMCEGYTPNDFVDCTNINDCADLSPSGEPIWLGELIDSIETIGCLEGCYSNITAYCSGNTNVPHVIYALETSENCADVPTIYYNEEGDIVCQFGAIWGTDCDSAFIPSLNYISDIWYCSDVSNCNNFTGTIEQSDQVICEGDTSLICVNAVGGFPPYTYSWSNDPNTLSGNCITINPTQTTIYTVNVVDAEGCSISLTAVVFVEDCGTDTTNCESDCSTEYDPVCVDITGGLITYHNACYALCAGWDESEFSACNVDSTGCDNCPTIFDPVCIATPSGGFLQFDNLCLALCEGYNESDLFECDSTTGTCNNFTATIEQSASEICLGESVVITAIPQGGTPPYNYEWGTCRVLGIRWYFIRLYLPIFRGDHRCFRVCLYTHSRREC